MSAVRQLATRATALAGSREARALTLAAREPEAAQRAVLDGILAGAADTAFGRAHAFARRGVAGYRTHVPPADYHALAPWIERIARGEARVLTAEPVERFERTGGTTASAKLIPFTAGLRQAFQRAVSAWMADLHARYPALHGRLCYWSISPSGWQPESTPGGVPIGLEDDTAYFDPLTRWVLAKTLAVPPAVRLVPELAANRRVTLRLLLVEPRALGLISVWNPSFLTLLHQALLQEGEDLVEAIASGRPEPAAPAALAGALSRANPAAARALAACLPDGAPLGRLFPNLTVVSAWTHAQAERALPGLERALGDGIAIQPKGLLATEGVVTVPFGAGDPVLALTSHFYEFETPEGRLLGAHELEPGGEYGVLLTTQGGLYRYRLHDRVRVTGFFHHAPRLRFLGKAAHACDLVGEKLAASHVEAALAALAPGAAFAMLAPEWPPEGPPGYLAFVSESSPGLAERLEEALRENAHYAYARDLGQLRPLEVVPVGPGAHAAYEAGCVALGRKAGDVKPVALHADPGWRARLAAGALA